MFHRTSLADLKSAPGPPWFKDVKLSRKTITTMTRMRLDQLYLSHNLTQRAFKEILKYCRKILPEENKMPSSFYHILKIIEDLGPDFKFIKHCCLNTHPHRIRQKSNRLCETCQEEYTLVHALFRCKKYNRGGREFILKLRNVHNHLTKESFSVYKMKI